MADIKKMKKWFRFHYKDNKKRVQFDHQTEAPSNDRRGYPGHPDYTPTHFTVDRGSSQRRFRSQTPTFPLQSIPSTPHSGDEGSGYNSLNSRAASRSNTLNSSGAVSFTSTSRQRSLTPTFPLETHSLDDYYYVNMNGHKVKSRTPNGSLESYYLDSNVTTPRSRTLSPQRRPLVTNDEPRFTASNVDANIRGRNHGYYIKAAGLHESDGNKENLRLVYDRSRVASPLNSVSASRYESRDVSRRNSLGKGAAGDGVIGQRRYRPKKRPAPNPPPPGDFSVNNYNRQGGYNSFDSRSSSGEVAMKVFRKKKKAPTPPRLLLVMPEDMSYGTSHSDVYPIEPPVDYNARKSIESSEEDLYEPHNELPVPKLEIPVDIHDNEEDMTVDESQPITQVPTVVPPPPLPMPPDTPISTRSESPEPPPVPAKLLDDVTSDHVTPSDKPPRLGTLLRRDIEKAAMARIEKDQATQEIAKSPHQEFAEELRKAVDKRDNRIHSHKLNVRRFSKTSKVYRATVSPQISPRTPVNDIIDRAQEQAKLLDMAAIERQKLRRSARVESHEWTPEQDLDEVFGAEVKSSQEHYTARGGNYYVDTDTTTTTTTDPHRLYKNGKYAKPNRKSGNLNKLRRSLGRAFGSLSKGLVSGVKKSPGDDEVNEQYRPEEGWQIIYTEECDKAPSGAIKIKRMERQPAYAYNTQKGQLVYLPDFDRVIVTQDGRRIRETELHKGSKSPGVNKSMPIFGRKERPSLEGLFESTVSLHSQKADEERKEMQLIEQQFEQVRNINKRFTEHHVSGNQGDLSESKAWRSTPDLVNVPQSAGSFDDGVLSDSDVPLRTSSIRNYDKMSSEKILSSKRKKKSKSKKSTSDGMKSPRQKVLQKGMDYYARNNNPSRPTTPNPVYSSEDEDDDEGYDVATSHNSDPTNSDTSSKQKGADSFGDSGIGPESLNSSASTASGAPIAAQMSHSFTTGPVYYTSLPPGVVFTPPSYPQFLQNPGTYPAVGVPHSSGTPHPVVGAPVVYQTLYYPSSEHSKSLPAGTVMPAPTLLDNTKYNTMPSYNTNNLLPENFINSDSNSTLVASNPELSNTLKSESGGGASKVFNVNPNIALITYSQQPSIQNPAQTSSNPAQTSLNSAQTGSNMFSHGYRPIKFNPKTNVNQEGSAATYKHKNNSVQPDKSGDNPVQGVKLNNVANNHSSSNNHVTNEDKPSSGDNHVTNEDNPSSGDNHVTNEDNPSSGDNHVTNEDNPSSGDNYMTNEDKPSSGDNSGDTNNNSKATTNHVGSLNHVTNEHQSDSNNNQDQSNGVNDVATPGDDGGSDMLIPQDIQHKYGHEDLIYL